jgi:flagellar hook-associated protein 2
MEISDSSYPTTMATNYANLSISGADTLLATQKSRATATTEGLSSLRSALETFQDALDKVTSSKSGALSYSATVSGSAVTATASAGAAAGSYVIYVDQLASTHQLTSTAVANVDPSTAGTLGVSLADGTKFSVDLSNADSDGDGTLSAAEIARAINLAADGAVTVSTLTINGEQRLIFNSNTSGADGAMTLDVSKIGDSNLSSALSNASETSPATDAVLHLGGSNGTRVQQSSNTFTGIQGVDVVLTTASATSTVTVGVDSTTTQANVQAFVDAYNALKVVLDKLTAVGDANNGVESGVFSTDSGVRALVSQLTAMLRTASDGKSLATLGITGDRDGNLQLDSTRLLAALASDPDAITSVIGSGSSGVTGSMTTYLGTWLSSTGGLLKGREDSAADVQEQLNKKQTEVNEEYDRLYKRYLTQFTAVQTLNSQMQSTLSLLDALYGNDNKS